MGNCDLCGKICEEFYKALIEGTQLNVCLDCSKLGKVLSQVVKKKSEPEQKTTIQKKPGKIEIEYGIKEGYSELVKLKREKMGLTQKQLAEKVSEKESVITNIERGKLEPSIATAKKLEKFFGISLIEEVQMSSSVKEKKDSEVLTIGDLINLK